MLKRITLFLSMVVFVGVLAACGSENTTSGSGSESNSAPKEEPKAAEQKDVEKSAEKVEKEDESSEVKKDKDGNVILETVGQVHEDETGIVELLAIKDINETIDMKPMTMTIEDIKIFNFKVEDEDMASYLSQWDGTSDGDFNYMQINYSLENTSEDNLTINFPIYTLVLNTGEQIEVMNNDIILDQNNGGDFFGKVKKESVIGVIMESDPSEVKTVKIITDSIFDKEYNTIVEPKEVTYEF
ncbi:hypothetical protein [Sutcliffiella horikoshii]|uniref:hypothetical protein n=1 Tax=Sutcliffiella horikoshii TaxID=79883 RepID=UPI003CFA1EF7